MAAKRGRPKGSKNKPKGSTAKSGMRGTKHTAEMKLFQSRMAAAMAGRILDVPGASKRGRGRPKGSKNKKGAWATVPASQLKAAKAKNQIPLAVLQANYLKLGRTIASRLN